MTDVDLADLLDSLDGDVKTELDSTPEVVVKGHALDVGSLPKEARLWHSLTDAVAVVADLKNSTKLSVKKWPQSTASIYEASTGGVVKIFNQFDANFLAIQGDGAFALFWGKLRYERALCAGITIKTFSKKLTLRLEKRWPNNLPETGLKVGVASSPLLAKRIGTPRNPAEQEPVWAGKAVNYAAKAAQMADRHIMVVTGTVWDVVEKNDYLAATCPCGDGPSLSCWQDIEIDRLPAHELERDAQGRKLTSSWCDSHGVEYCSAVLDGKTRRGDIDGLRPALSQSQMRGAIRSVAHQKRKERTARRRGLS